jgi:hypothetical protein
MALAAPVISRNDHGELVFAPKISHDIASKLQSGSSHARSGTISAPVAPKLQEHNVLRLVDAMNVAFEDRRRKLEGNNKTSHRISLANKADIKPLSTSPVERPAWIVPDQRQLRIFSFIQN